MNEDEETKMPEHTLTRLLTAWNDPEAEGRAQILDDTLSADGVYYSDPHLPEPAEGRAAFESYLEKFTGALPDGEMETGPVDEHHNHARVEFRILRAGQPLAQGHYFAELDGEGRVARLVGFM